jgi:serine protease Do
MSGHWPDWGTGRRQVFCSRCGAPADPSAHFCGSCGAPLQGHGDAPIHGTDPSGGPRGRSWLLPVAAGLVLGLLGLGLAGLLLVRQGGAPDGTPAATPLTTSPTSSPSSPTATTSSSTSPTSPPTSSATSSNTTASFASLYRRVSSGVVQIDATTCDGGGIGTGFLIGPDLVATAAHVVDGAAALGLTVGEDGAGGVASGIVVGIDRASDLAVVRTDRALAGHVFTLARRSPQVGQDVAAIGFPVDEPMTLTRGSVSGLNRTITIDGVDRHGLIQTDTALNPGNSGGPVLARDGKVYGIVDAKLNGAEGIGYAVSSDVARPRLRAWKDATTEVVSAPCDLPQAPQPSRDPNAQGPGAGGPQSDSVVTFFDTYFEAINTADYDTVWALLSPGLRGSSPDALAEGYATTFDTNVQVHSVTSKPKGRVLAHVTFTSFQAPENGPDGDMCDHWDLDYLLDPVDGFWQIHAVSGYRNGATHRAC